MESSLHLHCPACGNRIRARLGCRRSFLIEAVQLQSAACGTELCCHACRLHHVVIHIDVSRGQPPTGLGASSQGAESFGTFPSVSGPVSDPLPSDDE